MLIALLLVVLIVAPSIFLFTNIFYSTYESMAKNQLDRGISAGRMFVDSIMSTTDNLALNRQLIETLDGTRSGSLTPFWTPPAPIRSTSPPSPCTAKTAPSIPRPA